MHTLTKVTYSMAILTLSELDCYAFCLTQGYRIAGICFAVTKS